MGRRALRKIDPSLDLSRNFKRLEALPRPWDHVTVFGRTAPLEVEIGSGKGLFLRGAAAKQPDVDFLGIEINFRYAEFAAAGLAKRGLINAVAVVGDAVQLFEEVLPEGSLRAIHIYFPDPWWKKRHKKRRVMRESLARRIEQTLQSGGSLHFWTDVEEYFQTARELIAGETHLQGPLEVPERPAVDDMDYHTHFERRTRLHNQPVYRAEYRKS